MKKFLLVLVVLLPLFAYAQTIVLDDLRNGYRRVETNQKRATGMVEKVKQFYSVFGIQDVETGRTSYSLDLQTNWGRPFCIEKGMKLLLKSMRGEIIILEAIETLDVRTGTYLDEAKSLVYTGTASYEITIDDVRKMASGIRKVRIETTTGFVDEEFSQDKIGHFIEESFVLVQKTINTKKSDVTVGF